MLGGILDIQGVETKYIRAEAFVLHRSLKYVDVFGMIPFIERLSFNPTTRRLDPFNLLLTGPKGTGKSLLPAYWAWMNKIPYLSFDCSEETKERHLKGGFVAKSGSTPYVLGKIANAIQVANEAGIALLVLEEINALSPQMQKLLNPLTDFRRKIEIEELSWKVEVATDARLFIIATMNPSVYGGTYELNEDLKSRFTEIDIPYPAVGMEKRILKEMAPDGITQEMIDQLVEIARQSRQGATGYALSPRDLVHLLDAIPRVGYADALFLAAQKFSEQDRRLMIDRIQDITRCKVHLNVSERSTHGG